MSIGQMSIGQMAVLQMAFVQMSVNQMSVGQMLFIRKDCFQVKSNLLTVDNLVFHY